MGKVARARGTVPSVDTEMDGWAEGKHAESVEAVTFLLGSGTALITPESWNQITTSFSQYCPEGFRGSRSAADILKDLQEAAG